MNTLQEIQETLLDLVENNAKKEELQRAFPFVRGDHYYPRMQQLVKEETELKNKILDIKTSATTEITQETIYGETILVDEGIQYLYEKVFK